MPSTVRSTSVRKDYRATKCTERQPRSTTKDHRTTRCPRRAAVVNARDEDARVIDDLQLQTQLLRRVRPHHLCGEVGLGRNGIASTWGLEDGRNSSVSDQRPARAGRESARFGAN